MSEDKKPKSTVGEPIWVESLMNSEDYAETAKKYPKTFVKGSKPVQYNSNYHKDGKWRFGMGSNPTQEEIDKTNREFDSLREFVLSQQTK